MKEKKVKEELRSLSLDQLIEKLQSLRHELFTLRLNAQTAHVKDYSGFRKLSRNIARVLTVIRCDHNRRVNEL